MNHPITKEYFLPCRKFKTHTRGIDLLYSLANVPVLFIWKNQQISFLSMKESFLRVLEQVPILGARLTREKGEWMIDVEGSRGCLFECWKSTRPLPLESESDTVWNPYCFTSSRFEKEQLVKIRIIHFTSGMAIHISYAHVLMDANGLHRVMKRWSDEIEKKSTNDREFQCSRVPSAKEIPRSVMSKFQTALVIWRLWRSLSTFETRVFTCDQDELGAWKKDNQPGERWTSTNELILGMIWDQLKSTRQLYLIADLHGRCSEIPTDYLGNGFTILEVHSPELGTTLRDAALEIHDQVRTKLDQTYTLDEAYKGMDYLHHSGIATALQSLTLARECGKGSILYNSWTLFDWFQFTFGTGCPMDFMRLGSAFCAPQFIHVFPSRASRLTLRLTLSPKEMKQFVQGMPSIWKEGYGEN